MKIAQIGNFGPPASTENELHRALVALGQDVVGLQENAYGTFTELARDVGDYDLVVWTRTGWQPPVPHDEQYAMLDAAERAAVPTVGVHLDRWWDLNRENQIYEEPFFRGCDYMCTADGGHADQWLAAGINHKWFPPGVSALECVEGTARPEYESEIAFVGSWRGYGHHEWTHRMELVNWLGNEYAGRVRFWPEPDQPAVRGEALRDLYASVKVAVGDSCLVPNRFTGNPATRYSSDRIPETLGRGAFLIHPWVEGVTDGTLYNDGEHLVTWPLGDWNALGQQIEWALTGQTDTTRIAAAGREHVLANHTYTQRMRSLLTVLADEGHIPKTDEAAQVALF